jgi:hypothetical protein
MSYKIEKLKYVNSLGNSIQFGGSPYFVNENNLRDFAWSYSEINNSISKLDRNGIVTKSLTVKILAAEADLYDALNTLHKAMDTDCVKDSRGKLYIGNYYLECWITEAANKGYTKSGYLERTLSVATDRPYWTKAETFEFRKTGSTIESTGHDYPFDYPYDLGVGSDVSFLEVDSLGLCDFEMIIYGPVTDPEVVINGQIYKVYTDIYSGEFLRINSKNKEIFRYMSDGIPVNKFNNRADDNVFQKIPAGKNNITYNVPAGIDITYYDERSEPKWISS